MSVAVVNVHIIKPINSKTILTMANKCNCLDAITKADELFVLLIGVCVLLYDNEANDKLEIGVVKVKPMKVYDIPPTLWHNRRRGQ